MRSLTYLHKMIVYGILLSTLPILLTGIAAFLYSSHQMESHRIQANQQLLSQMQSNVEHKLATVSYMLDQATRSPVTIQSLSSPHLSPKQAIANKLQSEFQHMRSWEPLMDITLVNQTQDWLIDHAGLYLNTDFPLSLPMKDLLSNTLTSGWQLVPSSLFNNQERMKSSGCNYHIALARSIQTINNETNSALIAGIPACSLQTPSEAKDTNSSASGLIIVNREQRIIAHPDPSYMGKPLAATGLINSDTGVSLSEQLSPASLPASSSYGELRTSDQHYSMVYSQSPLKGWSYILVTPMNILNREYIQVALHTMYISIGMLLLSLLLSWLGSKRMHTPIRRLLSQVGIKEQVAATATSSLQVDSEISMDEFEQIRAGVSQLSASRSQLENKLNHYVMQTRNHFLMNIFLGKYPPTKLQHILNEQGYASKLKHWQHIAVITIQADLVNHAKYSSQDRELLLFAIQNMLEETILPELQLLPIVIEQTVVTVIGTYESDSDEFTMQLYAQTEQLQRRVQDLLSLRISIGISQSYPSLFEVHQAYTEALEALQHRLKLGTGVIIPYKTVKTHISHGSMVYPESFEYELIQAIQSVDETEAISMLHQLLEYVFNMESTPEEYQLMLMRLLTRILLMMQEVGVPLGQITIGQSSMFRELFTLQSAAEVEHWFTQRIIMPIVTILKERQYAQYPHISEKIIALIQQRYDTDLTLEECAALLHYNANYLSGVFRKETGCSFSEYLTKHRFTIAKKWLEETDLTVKDIAARLRYNNPQNFIRSFRKWEGITPGQYRERKRRAGYVQEGRSFGK
ncbi:helix-turn-helix domain-containing protein [Paenibacillus tundrae]|uniref:AraC-like DNA-binding protein n=1 Tax=Paenibacillus tundrae TaxID=528187 RepID=A0ABT9WFY6_9BACL|nr:helix-turn-helix domain-containing protein [Paenibacillus tundrae]MDQ0171917.1 AraC-like DNA-binding protein [Paenibacillus tundrae]